MPAGWWISTFDKTRWDALFSGNTPTTEQRVLDALLWEEERDTYVMRTDRHGRELRPGLPRDRLLASKQGESAQALARHIAGAGLSYRGLDPALAGPLDRLMHTICAVESFGTDLNVAHHSPDQLHLNTVRELLDRLGGRTAPPRQGPFGWAGWQPPPLPPSLHCLPLLLAGRRYGTEAEPPRSESKYVVLAPAEAAALRQEVLAAVEAPVPMPNTWYQSDIAHVLLEPLAHVIQGGRWVHMSHS